MAWCTKMKPTEELLIGDVAVRFHNAATIKVEVLAPANVRVLKRPIGLVAPKSPGRSQKPITLPPTPWDKK